MEILKLLNILKSRKKLFLYTALPIIIVPVLLTLFIPRVYKQSTKIWINTQDILPLYVSDLPSNMGKLSYLDNDNVIDTFVTLMLSNPVIERVVKEFDLRQSDGTLYDTRELTEAGTLKKYITQRLAVETKRIEDSEIFLLSVYSNDIKQATELSNAIAHGFKDIFSSISRRNSEKAVHFLESELQKARGQLSAAEKESLEFKKKNKLFDIDTQKSNLLSRLKDAVQSIDDTEKQKSEDLTLMKATLEGIKKQPEFKLSQKNIQANPVIQSALSKIFELEMEISEKLIDYTEEHPEVMALREKEGVAKDAVKNELTKSFSSETLARNGYLDNLLQQYGDAEIEVSTLDAKKAFMEGQKKALEGDLEELSAREVEFTRITLKGEEAKTLVSTLLSKLDMARISLAMDVSNAVIIENAYVPNNIKNNIAFPKRKITLIASGFIGCSAGIFLVLFMTYIDDTVRTKFDVEGVEDKSLFISLAGALSDGEGYSAGDASSAGAHNILTILAMKNKGKLPGVLTVTSLSGGEGKTAVAGHLAALAARQGHRVLAIDFDEKNAGFARFFGLSAAVSTETLNAAGVDIISAGTVDGVTSFQDKGDIKGLIEANKPNYDFIIINSQPLSSCLTSVVHAMLSDGFMLVTKPGLNKISDMEASLERFKKSGSRLLAAVFNG